MTVQTFTDTQIDINQFASLHNERVNAYFRKNKADQTEIAQQKAYLKTRLLINPADDSKIDCIFNCLWFDLQVANAFSNLAYVYGVPMLQHQEQVSYQPQLMFRFKEREINKLDLPLRKYKLEKEISFRLFKEDIPKNNAQLRALANKIKARFFAANKAYNYTSGASSGTTVYRYKDEDKGYRLAIEVNSKASAVKLIENFVELTGTKFALDKLSATAFTKDSTPEKITVLSNRVNKPVKGRYGKMYLYQVEYKQQGIRDKILLDQMGLIKV